MQLSLLHGDGEEGGGPPFDSGSLEGLDGQGLWSLLGLGCGIIREGLVSVGCRKPSVMGEKGRGRPGGKTANGIAQGEGRALRGPGGKLSPAVFMTGSSSAESWQRASHLKCVIYSQNTGLGVALWPPVCLNLTAFGFNFPLSKPQDLAPATKLWPALLWSSSSNPGSSYIA